jgi:hypothetical protein
LFDGVFGLEGLSFARERPAGQQRHWEMRTSVPGTLACIMSGNTLVHIGRVASIERAIRALNNIDKMTW